MNSFFSKVRIRLMNAAKFAKANILIILLIWVLIYQDNRIRELETDLWDGFAFRTVTNIVEELADARADLEDRIDELESNSEDGSYASSDLETRIDDLESIVEDNHGSLLSDIDDLDSRVDDLESNISNINFNISTIESDVSDIESDIQQIKWDL